MDEREHTESNVWRAHPGNALKDGQEEQFDYEAWKLKRRNTMLTYFFIVLVVGVDSSVVLATLYLYLKEMVNTKYPEFYYGLIMAAYSFSSAITGWIFGRWIDRTRKLKLYAMFVIVMQIIGSITYMFYFSPLLILSARLIAGISETFFSNCAGEIMRIYDKDEATIKFWLLASSHSIGLTIGPIFGIAFKNITNFNIGKLHVTYLNFTSMFMVFILIVALFIISSCVTDCSAEFDLQEYIKQTEQSSNGNTLEDTLNDDILSDRTDTLQTLSTCKSIEIVSDETLRDDIPMLPIPLVIKVYCTHIDVIIIFVSSFLFTYCLHSIDILIPLVILELLRWSVFDLAVILGIYGIAYLVSLLLVSKHVKNDRSVYLTTISCIVLQLFVLVILIIIKRQDRNRSRDIAMMTFFLVFYVFVWFIEDVLLSAVICRFVPSNYQSFTASLRNTFGQAAAVLSALSAPLAFSYLEWWSPGMCIVIFVLLVCFLVRHQTLCDVKEINFGERSFQYALLQG